MERLHTSEIRYINEKVRIKSNSHEYDGHGIEISQNKLKSLINMTPTENVIDTATYYLKNLILLQIFPDGNHRTAFSCTKYFLHKNNIEIQWDITLDDFHINIYKLRSKIYNTYEELNVSILTESHNELYKYIKKYIIDHCVNNTAGESPNLLR